MKPSALKHVIDKTRFVLGRGNSCGIVLRFFGRIRSKYAIEFVSFNDFPLSLRPTLRLIGWDDQGSQAGHGNRIRCLQCRAPCDNKTGQHQPSKTVAKILAVIYKKVHFSTQCDPEDSADATMPLSGFGAGAMR